MRTFFVLIFIIIKILLPLGLYTQSTDPDVALKRGSSVIPEAYDRSSLSWLLIYEKNDSYISNLKKSFSGIDHSAKYFLNPLEKSVIEFNYSRSTLRPGIPKNSIEAVINDNDFAQQVISYWYSRTDEGLMDMERIHERGMANATDADIIRVQSTKRGNWALMDYGNRLIERSYIISLDVTEVREIDTDRAEGYSASITASLFRVQLSAEDKDLIYESWVLEDDPDEEADRKRKLFETISPPIEYKTQIYTSASSRNYKEGYFLYSESSKKTKQELFDDIMQKAYDNVLFELERSYDEFNVITPLYSTKPLSAKIGLKEGLTVDQRFFVYEHRYNPITEEIVEVRRGVVRATPEITDNREVATGAMRPSKFYQVAGRRLHEGYVMQQSNDYGIGINFGANIGGFGGGGIGGDLAIGRVLGISAFYITGSLAFDSRDYPDFSNDNYNYTFDNNVSFARWDVSLAKGLHFFRNFELRPSVGLGQEIASNSALDDELRTVYFKLGGDLALNITYFMQVYAGYNLYGPTGVWEDEDPLDGLQYSDIFTDRKGGATSIGMRFKF